MDVFSRTAVLAWGFVVVEVVMMKHIFKRDMWIRALVAIAVVGLIVPHFIGPWWTELEYAGNARTPFDTTMWSDREFPTRVPASDAVDQRINAARLAVGFASLWLLLVASKFQMRACMLFWVLNFEIPYALLFVSWDIKLEWHWPSDVWGVSFMALPCLLVAWLLLIGWRVFALHQKRYI